MLNIYIWVHNFTKKLTKQQKLKANSIFRNKKKKISVCNYECALLDATFSESRSLTSKGKLHAIKMFIYHRIIKTHCGQVKSEIKSFKKSCPELLFKIPKRQLEYYGQVVRNTKYDVLHWGNMEKNRSISVTRTIKNKTNINGFE